MTDVPQVPQPRSGRSGPSHVPVLLPRVLELFEPVLSGRPAVLVDATVGLGGHAAALLAAHPELTLIGIDRDPQALEVAGRRLTGFGERAVLRRAVYDELPDVLADAGVAEIDGVLFDLGVSSLQLDEADRGFSYAQDAALDMRMDPDARRTAADVLNDYTVPELTRVLRDYGARRRAQSPLRTSAELVELLYQAVPAATRRTGGHPAKRTFQALRIEVNGELDALRDALPAALDALAVGGRAVVLAYHSLEDRIVKRTLTARASSRTPVGLPVELPDHGPEFQLITRGAEVADDAEIAENPRAASVRLRAAQRLVVPR
jgi:16S rRNA (cytosine1402-N4)-methyltransferase